MAFLVRLLVVVPLQVGFWMLTGEVREQGRMWSLNMFTVPLQVKFWSNGGEWKKMAVLVRLLVVVPLQVGFWMLTGEVQSMMCLMWF